MSRNAAGTYTLPAGNPVVTGTVITSTWANLTMPDIGTELTSSLDRSGRGSMLAPLKLTDGVVALPGGTFGNEPTSGLWRSAAGVLEMSVLAASITKWRATGFEVALAAGATVLDVKSVLASQASVRVGGNAYTTGTNSFDIIQDASFAYVWQRVALPMVFGTNATERMRIDGAGLVGIGVVPSVKLHVKSTGEIARMESTTARGSGQSYLQFNDPTGSKGLIGYGGSDDLFGVTNLLADLFFRAGAAERGRFLSGGGFVVGATSRAAIGSGSDDIAAASSIGTTIQMNFLPGAGNPAQMVNRSATGGWDFYINAAATVAFRISGAGVLSDTNSNELGFKGLPTASVTSGAFVAADKGKCVYASAGVTVPNSTMSQGDVVTVYNNTAGNITITATVATLRLAGTASTGNRTLALRGLATIFFISATEAVISGAGVS